VSICKIHAEESICYGMAHFTFSPAWFLALQKQLCSKAHMFISVVIHG